MKGYNHYDMLNGHELNQAIAELPKAEPVKVFVEGRGKGMKELKKFRAIKVTEHGGKQHFVSVPTTRYHTVQHEQAFRPIVEGLTLAGQHNFQFVLVSTERYADLQIYILPEGIKFNDMNKSDEFGGVMLGFSVKNSFDSSRALSYGFKAMFGKGYLELVGYRQVCANGMKIRVPLHKAEIIKPEIVGRVKELFSKYTRMLHTKNVPEKIQQMQFITEAMTLLRPSVELYIEKAQKWTIKDKKTYKRLIDTHVGKRFKKRVTDEFANQEQDLWGLYNAMTYVASHHDDLKHSSRETLLDKAAEMLLVEVA